MDSLYTESAYYRMLFAERTQDLSFYLRATDRLDATEEVLELGIGDGRVALALATQGRRVTGVDISASMLEALRERLCAASPEVAARVHALHDDARTVRLGRRFARVLCPFNGVAHFSLHRDALAAFFDTVRVHLGRGGLFAFDAMIPDPALLVGGGASVPWLRHPRTGAVCRMEEHYAYDPLAQVLTITTVLVERETDARQELTLALRQLFPEETLTLLAHHGFEVLERTEELGDSLAYVCRVASAR